VFVAFGHGAQVTCAVERDTSVDCYLKKRTATKTEERKFSRSQIAAVHWGVSTTTTQRSKSTKDFWTIEFKSGISLELTMRGVVWPRGNMNLPNLRALLLPDGKPSLHSLSMVAYGIEAWFLGLLPGAIGWALALVFMAKPVQGVSAETLRRSRLANLVMSLSVTAVTIATWLAFFHFWEKHLTN